MKVEENKQKTPNYLASQVVDPDAMASLRIAVATDSLVSSVGVDHPATKPPGSSEDQHDDVQGKQGNVVVKYKHGSDILSSIILHPGSWRHIPVNYAGAEVLCYKLFILKYALLQFLGPRCGLLLHLSY